MDMDPDNSMGGDSNPSSAPSPGEASPSQESKPLFCLLCSKAFDTEDGLRAHMPEHADKRWV